MKSVIRCAALILVLWSTNSMACGFDADCAPGSKCLKRSGQLYGVCVGGISPGNRNDRQPVYSPTDPNRTTGNTCGFDTDCGPGSTCLKSSGSIYGTCLRSGTHPTPARQAVPAYPSPPLPRTAPRPGESYLGHLMRDQAERQKAGSAKP